MSTEFERPGDVLEAFAKRLTDAADLAGLPHGSAEAIVSGDFRGGAGSGVASITASDLPAAGMGLKIGRYTLVLGLLPDTSNLNAIREAVRRYRNQCVIARSYLSPNEALDLQLLLVGPVGSEDSPDWKAAALMVERDDRVARKLIWLRPGDPVNVATSFAEFLGRSFLARPWVVADALDPALLDELNSKDGGGTGVPRNTAEAWEAIALREEEDPMRTVNLVIEAWAKRGAA